MNKANYMSIASFQEFLDKDYLGHIYEDLSPVILSVVKKLVMQ